MFFTSQGVRDWITVGKDRLSMQQEKVEQGMFLFLLSLYFHYQ